MKNFNHYADADANANANADADADADARASKSTLLVGAGNNAHKRDVQRTLSHLQRMATKGGDTGTREDVVVQWVNKVTNYSSQYDATNWCANQVIGQPKVYPKYGDIPGAWAMQQCDSNQFVEVQYKEAVFVTGIDIYETYHAGGVKAILAKSPAKQWVPLWTSSESPKAITTSRIFSPPLQELGFQIKDIRIEVDCTSCNTWVEIDAVKLLGKRFCTAPPPSMDTLSKDMSIIVNDARFSDVQFSVEDKTVYGHKAILIARSDYFRAMFCDQMKESRTSVPIVMKDVSYEGFKGFLHYLYTNTLPNTFDCVALTDLWRVGDQYSADGLKSLASFLIGQCLNEHNVVDTFMASSERLPVIDEVRSNCILFMSTNMSKVVNTPKFAKLPQEVMLDIIQCTTSKLHI